MERFNLTPAEAKMILTHRRKSAKLDWVQSPYDNSSEAKVGDIYLVVFATPDKWMFGAVDSDFNPINTDSDWYQTEEEAKSAAETWGNERNFA